MKIEYGIQMYSIRDLAKVDLEAALKTVSEQGYKYVEFAGFFENSAEDVASWLKKYNLTVSGTHTGAVELKPEVLAETIAYHKTIGNTKIIIPGFNQSTMENVNEIITPRAIKYIEEQQPDFLFLYLADTDNTGHKYGWLSKEYMQDAHDAVACVKQVYDKFGNDYNIIFLADHGGHDRTHGTEMPEDMTIPLFFFGRSFEQGKVLPTASIKDVAPTVAALLEAEPAEEWEGTSAV